MEKKTNAFVDILKRDNEKIKADRAVRIGQSVKEAHISMLMDMRSKVRQLEDRLSAMTDLSSSNDSTDANIVKEIDSTLFVKQYQEIKEKISIEKMKYDIAVKTGEELFGIDIQSLS